MNENGVSLKSVHDCMVEHKDDIDKMDRIFDSDEGECVNKRMVLLSIISRSYAKENMDLYRAANNIGSEFGCSTDIEKYKLLIITALMFNTMFYTNACNWCGLIRYEVIRVKEMTKRDKATYELSRKNHSCVIIIFKRIEEYRKVAATKKEMFKEFFRCEGITHEGVSGTLIFRGNDQNQVILKFEFDKFQHKIPFDMEVQFMTKKDGLPHTVKLDKRINNREKGISVIESEVIDGIFYSDGIEGISEET
jgi:hypothetical protein